MLNISANTKENKPIWQVAKIAKIPSFNIVPISDILKEVLASPIACIALMIGVSK